MLLYHKVLMVCAINDLYGVIKMINLPISANVHTDIYFDYTTIYMLLFIFKYINYPKKTYVF